MSLWKLLSLLVVCVALVGAGDPEHNEEDNEHEGEHKGGHWSYHGDYYADHWYKLHPLCAATSPRQSPINVVHEDSVFEDSLDSIVLKEDIDRRYRQMDITNNGHSVNVKVDHDALIVGGHLPSKGYMVAGVHFHWGLDDTLGSEHQVDNKKFPLEMHMVSYDTENYDTLGDAVNGDDSLAVLGTLFQVSEEDNPVFDSIIKNLYKVQQSGSENTIPIIHLADLLPKNTNKYFRYYGSLTTPPCAESVIWTIFLHTQTVSAYQLNEFRQLMESRDENGVTHPIVDNWRPIQDIKGRVVHRSFLFKSEMSKPVGGHSGQGPSSAAVPTAGVATVLALLVALLM